MTTTKATMAKQAAHEAVDQVVSGAFRLAAGTMQNAADKAVEQLRIHRMAHEIIGAAFGTIEQEAAIEARAAFEQEAATKDAAATARSIEALMVATRLSPEYAMEPELYEAAGRMLAGSASDEDRGLVQAATAALQGGEAGPDPVGLPPGVVPASSSSESEGPPVDAPATGGGPTGLPAWVEADAATAPAQEPAAALEPGPPVDATPPVPAAAPAARRARKPRKV